MAENFRSGDRTDWHSTRMTTEPKIMKRPVSKKSDHVGSEDDHENPNEQR